MTYFYVTQIPARRGGENVLSRKERKKIAAFFGRTPFSIWDDIIDDWLVPCAVAAATAFVVTMIISSTG